jgi:membrane-bound lytic murein transglycosylase MltF
MAADTRSKDRGGRRRSTSVGERGAGLAMLLGLCVACQAPPPAPAASASPLSRPKAAAAASAAPLDPAPEATPPIAGLAPFIEPFAGDLDGMVSRRFIRVLTVQNPILYFVDRGREVGIVHDTFKVFEKELNETLGNEVVRVHVILIPVARDQLIPRLLAGQGDIAAAAFTITPERSGRVDFIPTVSGVREVVVTGPGAPPITTAEELAGQEVYVRPSSSHAEHLRTFDARLKALGLPPVTVVPAAEVLEAGDILEMVNAGLVARTVVDDFSADLYKAVFPGLQTGLALGEPGQLGWAVRPRSPKLAAALNAFLKRHGPGTLLGNMLLARYVKTQRWVKTARSDAERQRFETMAALFKKYSTRYDFDYLLMAAQGFQESGLDQQKRSPAGAIGVMQVLPATARDRSVGIPNIERLETNIHAGIKYNRWVADNFYQDPEITPLNRQLFVFASYNAGPARVAALRREAKTTGLDPNVWFNNVELVAAKRIGRETVVYVANIYKYYLAYQMMVKTKEARLAVKRAAAN